MFLRILRRHKRFALSTWWRHHIENALRATEQKEYQHHHHHKAQHTANNNHRLGVADFLRAAAQIQREKKKHKKKAKFTR